MAFTSEQIAAIEEKAQTGLSLIDCITVVCKVPPGEAARLATDPIIRDCFAIAQAVGSGNVMRALTEQAQSGNASAAATLWRAQAAKVEQEFAEEIAAEAEEPLDEEITESIKQSFDLQEQLVRGHMPPEAFVDGPPIFSLRKGWLVGGEWKWIDGRWELIDGVYSTVKAGSGHVENGVWYLPHDK
jgi:hypothetical protein